MRLCQYGKVVVVNMCGKMQVYVDGMFEALIVALDSKLALFCVLYRYITCVSQRNVICPSVSLCVQMEK
jgi:hypothetical protein